MEAAGLSGGSSLRSKYASEKTGSLCLLLGPITVKVTREQFGLTGVHIKTQKGFRTVMLIGLVLFLGSCRLQVGVETITEKEEVIGYLLSPQITRLA